MSLRFSLLVGCLVASTLAAAPCRAGRDPDVGAACVRMSDGWQCLLPHANEYLSYAASGKDVSLQDANHLKLGLAVGLMTTFTSAAQMKTHATSSTALLDAQAQWELDFWKTRTAHVETVLRPDLAGPGNDTRVTEMTLTNQTGKQMKVDSITVASRDGVFVLAISPASADSDATVKAIAASVRLIPRALTPQDVANLSKAQLRSSEK